MIAANALHTRSRVRQRHSKNVGTELWGDMLVPLRLSCADHLRVISAQRWTGVQQTMGTKESAGHSKVIRKLEPIVQRTANDLFLSATNVDSAALKQK
jgi:hypothetical protein